jgi:hypothetical protein
MLSPLVYPDVPMFPGFDETPGLRLESFLKSLPKEQADYLQRKLGDSCLKLCMAWLASDRALATEREFYSSTFHDAPALYGRDAIEVGYHLEAFILFARSSLDIGATVFAALHPLLPEKPRFDSFNKLTKALAARVKRDPETSRQFAGAENLYRAHMDKNCWLSVLCGSQRGRSLRDKISHQTAFPIEYLELSDSEKESAVVILGESFMPLPNFVQTIRDLLVHTLLALEADIVANRVS